jgi:hypothetical protein
MDEFKAGVTHDPMKSIATALLAQYSRAPARESIMAHRLRRAMRENGVEVGAGDQEGGVHGRRTVTFAEAGAAAGPSGRGGRGSQRGGSATITGQRGGSATITGQRGRYHTVIAGDAGGRAVSGGSRAAQGRADQGGRGQGEANQGGRGGGGHGQGIGDQGRGAQARRG